MLRVDLTVQLGGHMLSSLVPQGSAQNETRKLEIGVAKTAQI